MNTYLQEIINKYDEFRNYLNEINIETFKKFSRQELMEFVSTIRKSDNFRFLCLDIDKIIDEKKLNEFPELLGVHNYPEIKEMDFLTEDEQIKLDTYLAQLGFSSYIYKGSTLWNKFAKGLSEEKQDKIFEFLFYKEIVERYFKVYVCCEEKLYSQTVMNNFITYFRLLDENGGKIPYSVYEQHEHFVETMLEEIETCCEECGDEYTIPRERIEEAYKNTWCQLYKVIKQRDKTYDNK